RCGRGRRASPTVIAPRCSATRSSRRRATAGASSSKKRRLRPVRETMRERGGETVSDQDHEREGLSRRDLLVGGGLLLARARLIGAPAAAAATRRASAAEATWNYAVITHGAGDLFWVVCHNGVN